VFVGRNGRSSPIGVSRNILPTADTDEQYTKSSRRDDCGLHRFRLPIHVDRDQLLGTVGQDHRAGHASGVNDVRSRSGKEFPQAVASERSSLI
jgi:hypothetical protein